MVQLRDLRADDLAACHAINQAEVPAVGSVTLDELAHIVDVSVIALVAVDEAGTVGGFCLVLPTGVAYGSQNYGWFSERFERFIYLDRVAIAPAFQRQGIGVQMYAEVECLAAERLPDAELFALEVNLVPRNDPSLAFHDRLGFEQVGVRSPSADYSVSMMTKRLSDR